MATQINYVNGRKVWEAGRVDSEGIKPHISLSVALGDKEEGGSAVPSASTEEKLTLAGLTDLEIKRFKEKLLNQALSELDYSLVQPPAPLDSPILQHMASANNMRAGRETREILMAKANSEYMKTDIQVKLKELELKKESNNQNDVVITMMSENYLQNEQMININNRISAHLYGLKNNLESISSDLRKISEISTSQKAVNEKLLEKLNQETSRDILYNGQTYTKTEIEKLGAVENLKGAKDENEFNLNEALDLVEDFFTDGFDIETNPIEILINSLKDSLKTEFNEINIKYNLGMETLR